MAVGDPGVPFDEAVARAVGVLRRPRPAGVGPGRGRLRTAARFEDAAGRRPGRARPTREFQLASVAQASRAVRRLLPASAADACRCRSTATPAWLANDERALAHPEDAAAVLEGPDAGRLRVGARGRRGAWCQGPGRLRRRLGRHHRRVGVPRPPTPGPGAGRDGRAARVGGRAGRRRRRTSRSAATTHPRWRSTRGWGSAPTTPTATSRPEEADVRTLLVLVDPASRDCSSPLRRRRRTPTAKR